ncbi:glutamate-rich protein 6B [Pseudophryne corroboree]|uniref:glutamate-rich protein 6B n=1 Tax=Pseudophryne corroboree TaxID=495146 RepID=UPI003081B9C5
MQTNQENTMAKKSEEHLQEQVSRLSALTVENVTKLELQYESIDGVLQERQKVEKYIQKTQQSGELQRSTGSLLLTVQEQDSQRLRKSRINTTKGGNNKVFTSSDSVPQIHSKVLSSESKQPVNVGKCKNIQTQTEDSWHDISTAIRSPVISKCAETPEPDGIETKMSTSKATEQRSITTENTMVSKSSDSATGEMPGQSENPLYFEDDPPLQGEVVCEFCHMPKKTIPSVEQIVSEPGETLFCCVKNQELFQFLIMNSIELYTPEDAEEKNKAEIQLPEMSNEMKAQHGLREDIDLYIPEEAEEENEGETKPPDMLKELKAVHCLREELKKINTKQYITLLVDHIRTCGSLFMTEKITFSLASANGRFINNLQAADLNSDPVHSIDDYFIHFPVLDNKLAKMPSETINKRYSSGQDFLIIFPDGTGQVLYPSGNIGILIACSKPTQFTFIILEDAEDNPQIQAVFMSNGHAACYHQNGMLWTVLDPFGGFYFDESGTWKKHWTWWDVSQHVHAPPFQSITLKLNPNVEVKMLTQDQIYLSFTKEKERVTFNVGSKLMLKDPKNIFQLKTWIDETEWYLYSKRHQTYSLLNRMKNLLRISNSSQSTFETMQKYICQVQKSLNYISGLVSKK